MPPNSRSGVNVRKKGDVMHLVIESVLYESINLTHYYVRFAHADKGRCEAWIDNKKESEEIEGGDKKNYSIYVLA